LAARADHDHTIAETAVETTTHRAADRIGRIDGRSRVSVRRSVCALSD
jgi:hypothetical protein